jgi:type IV pilus assembly protein PilM
VSNLNNTRRVRIDKAFFGGDRLRVFRRPTVTLGLDIGSYNVKGVRLVKERASAIRLTGFSVAEVDQNLNLKNPFEATLSALAQVIKDFELKNTRVVTSLGGHNLVIKQVTFPTTASKEIESSLPWEAGKHIPFSSDSVEFACQVKKINKEGKTSEVLLAAVDKGYFQNHLDLLSRLNLQPWIIDVNPLALANAFLAFCRDNGEKNHVLIDLGASATTISIFQKGGFFFTRDISLGGKSFTQAMHENYKMDYSRAEAFKKEGKISFEVTKPVFDQFLLEIRQSLLYYDTRTGHKGFEEIIITGGTSQIVGLASFLQENLNLPVNCFRPLENIKIDEQVSFESLEKWESQLGVAIGLALRG